ncbi:beta-ketoacyl-[acyl-carrier-protein] synthase family protein [Streptomyces sp. WMMC500]|uniref:beta-ketoacyl-[acyl-carrier-protein] synthase family protein n=1 Tax=Streptomyces sp. WMMC500 TaxID=3015154 RepID=UPI00248AA758|nr:beta-ketoacyl-[acyl-carrier-protein] synthase family protein [Streptomyces sp. WMMC500]WBB58142.1 beta-ketoacyl-[acyl-carrier-protein] synthase family protein [Streptomyces sp. WMMC500]
MITGIGVRAPGGVGTDAFWRLLVSGRTATRTMTLIDPAPFRSRVAAEIDFDPAAEGLTLAEAETYDRATQLAIAATREAVLSSGLDPARRDPARTAVSIGTAVGCTTSLDLDYRRVSHDGTRWLVDHTVTAERIFDYFVPSSIGRDVAWETGAEGPVTVISTGCTSGLDAVGYGADLIRTGRADVVFCGATDAPISPITVACFDAIKATSVNNDDPGRASRPFDRNRDGFVLGEGAAVFVMEELAAARRRRAHLYAEVRGFATRSNAYHMTGLTRDGREMAEAIRAAMRQARRTGDDLGYINAHGSGTRQNDRHETAAFKRSLGSRAYEVPVSSIKSMIGHSLGAIGSLELAASALVIEHGVIPPTANYDEPDPECDLDYVPNVARERRVDTVLSVGSGFGGFQSAAVLGRPPAKAAAP